MDTTLLQLIALMLSSAAGGYYLRQIFEPIPTEKAMDEGGQKQ